MPAYGMPGVDSSRKKSRVIGVAALALATVLVLGWNITSPLRTPDDIRVQLRTNLIGDGVIEGAEVRLNGVRIGTIAAIGNQPNGRHLLTLALRPEAAPGLTDSFDIDYAPSNLFGISAVTVKRRPGGAPLRGGELIDLTAAQRVTDVTMGSLLRSLSGTATNVLTPQLTELLTSAAADLDAFTPLLEAMVGTGRAVAETQRYPSSFLIDQYGSFLGGVGNFAEGLIRLVNEVHSMNVLRTDRERFDVGVALVVDQLFPALAGLGTTGQRYLGDYATTLAAVLSQLAQTVPTPAQSSADLTDLLNRLAASFRDTPEGPELGVQIVLRGIPGIAVPLFGAAVPPSGGQR